ANPTPTDSILIVSLLRKVGSALVGASFLASGGKHPPSSWSREILGISPGPTAPRDDGFFAGTEIAIMSLFAIDLFLYEIVKAERRMPLLGERPRLHIGEEEGVVLRPPPFPAHDWRDVGVRQDPPPNKPTPKGRPKRPA